MEEYIKNPVKLDFNPLEEGVDYKIKEIFEDRLARTLWMGMKEVQTQSKDFNDACLYVSEIFEKLGTPNTPKKLEYILTKYFDIPFSKKFAEEIFPYVSGSKNIEYEVIKQ